MPRRSTRRLPAYLTRFVGYPRTLTNRDGLTVSLHDVVYTPEYWSTWLGMQRAQECGVDPGWAWEPLECLVSYAASVYHCERCTRSIIYGELHAVSEHKRPRRRFCIDCIVSVPLPPKFGEFYPAPEVVRTALPGNPAPAPDSSR